MSILFVLLMFLLILTISYFCSPGAEAVARPQRSLDPIPAPRMDRSLGLSLPQNYSFHPGHTWVSRENYENARIGLDSFAANLIGKIDRIDVIGENRWVRQGQRIATVHTGDAAIDLVSPVEGVIIAINRDALQDPAAITRDPYEKGWLALVKSPDLAINQKNLLQGAMVAPWLQNSITRLNGLVADLAPAMAADGGTPIAGIIARVPADLRQKLLAEFFFA